MNDQIFGIIRKVDLCLKHSKVSRDGQKKTRSPEKSLSERNFPSFNFLIL